MSFLFFTSSSLSIDLILSYICSFLIIFFLFILFFSIFSTFIFFLSFTLIHSRFFFIFPFRWLYFFQYTSFFVPHCIHPLSLYLLVVRILFVIFLFFNFFVLLQNHYYCTTTNHVCITLFNYMHNIFKHLLLLAFSLFFFFFFNRKQCISFSSFLRTPPSHAVCILPLQLRLILYNCAKYSFMNNILIFIHSVEPITLIDNSMSNYAKKWLLYSEREMCVFFVVGHGVFLDFFFSSSFFFFFFPLC